MRERPKRGPVKRVHRIPTPDGGRDKDHAFDPREVVTVRGNNRHGRTHAFTHQVNGGRGVTLAHRLYHIRSIAHQVLLTRPDTALCRRAEAALIIGVNGNVLQSHEFAGYLETVTVIVEPVQRDDDRVGFVRRQPAAIGKLRAVGCGQEIFT